MGPRQGLGQTIAAGPGPAEVNLGLAQAGTVSFQGLWDVWAAHEQMHRNQLLMHWYALERKERAQGGST